jgi:3',5'-cyclic AMP phosphodiesterase CpdA
MDDAFRFLRHDLLDALAGGLRSADRAIAARASIKKAKRILHLSNLHIGLDEATQRRSYLKRHIKTLLPTVQRLLVVPGNHDMRVKGNAFGGFGRKAEFVTDLDWSPIDVDHDIQTTFFSFNSSEGGNFARGGVSLRQRLLRAELHDAELQRRSSVGDYFNIALVHHHPVDYFSQPTALYERILAKLGGEDRFISFEEADDFLNWCSSRRVGLVLHGHKHIPHLATVQFSRTGGSAVTVVGSGSSVGAGRKPMCYDVVTIEPETKRWSVSFHQDERGDGSGFELQNVALDLHRHQ